jgi:hypothetical protein
VPTVASKLLPILPLTRHQALGVIDTSTAMPETNAATVSSPLLPRSAPLSSPSPAAATAEQQVVQNAGSEAHIPSLPLTSLTPTMTDASSALTGDSEAHTATNVHPRFHTHTTTDPCDDSDSDSSYDYLPLAPCSMSANTPAECLHAEPKHIPLLTPGEVSPMVMRQWEMACEDFFSANSKLEETERIAAVLPGLKDMQARDWVATHHSELTSLSFAGFMKTLCREFLTDGWDDKLHADGCLRSPRAGATTNLIAEGVG